MFFARLSREVNIRPIPVIARLEHTIESKRDLIPGCSAICRDRVANCGVRKIRYRNGLRPRISFDQEKDSRGRRPQWKLYSKTPSR